MSAEERLGKALEALDFNRNKAANYLLEIHSLQDSVRKLRLNDADVSIAAQ